MNPEFQLEGQASLRAEPWGTAQGPWVMMSGSAEAMESQLGCAEGRERVRRTQAWPEVAESRAVHWKQEESRNRTPSWRGSLTGII